MSSSDQRELLSVSLRNLPVEGIVCRMPPLTASIYEHVNTAMPELCNVSTAGVVRDEQILANLTLFTR